MYMYIYIYTHICLYIHIYIYMCTPLAAVLCNTAAGNTSLTRLGEMVCSAHGAHAAGETFDAFRRSWGVPLPHGSRSKSTKLFGTKMVAPGVTLNVES